MSANRRRTPLLVVFVTESLTKSSTFMFLNGKNMRPASLILVASLAAASFVPPVSAIAASKHNGACVGFAGTMSGKYRYAGLKCYLDSAPGNWVIRSSVKEKDDPKAYKDLLRIPKRPVRCTLTRGATDGADILYKISNC